MQGRLREPLPSFLQKIRILLVNKRKNTVCCPLFRVESVEKNVHCVILLSEIDYVGGYYTKGNFLCDVYLCLIWKFAVLPIKYP